MAKVANCLAVDCGRTAPVADAAPRGYPGVELMAKDFDSLLRALLDRLPQFAPDWRDRSEADLGMVLLELFAYAGDQLSYLQDRVALEGYLRTATQYESVRKLLRLIDYSLDPGQAAQATLLFEVVGNAPLYLPAGFQLLTRASPAAPAVVFETTAAAVLRPAISRVALAADAPSSADGLQAVFAADLSGAVAAGDRLLLQQGTTLEWVEVAGAVFGAVSILTFTQPLRSRYNTSAGAAGEPPARLHGNAVAATHGASVVQSAIADGRAGQRIELDQAPLTWVAAAGVGGGAGSGAIHAVPLSTLSVAVDGETWLAVEDFIDSEPADRHYRVSRDNDANQTLHFGDGVHAAAPSFGAKIVLRYRVGIGAAGHVGADALTEFDRAFRFPDASQQITGVRNPFAASGAREPEALASAKLLGPYQLRTQNRAVVPADHEASLAAGVWIGPTRWVPVQSRARLRHTGSWNTMVVSVDMPGRQPLAATPGLRDALEALLQARKMAGIDVRVEDARYCALHIGLKVEVDPQHFARDVRTAVERALVGLRAGAMVGPLAGAPADTLPFFGPGRFGFGQAVYLSDLYAAVSAIEGVASVAVTRFKRLGDRYPDNEAAGLIPVGALEVARCDNNTRTDETTNNGVLFVSTCGGKEG